MHFLKIVMLLMHNLKFVAFKGGTDFSSVTLCVVGFIMM